MTKDEPDECLRNFLKSWLNYKGLENFFRRVAFNLGNTPSKTEVKIVSCIPIDVTDLQERIAYLERQLEEKAAFGREKHESAILYTNENCDSSKHSVDSSKDDIIGLSTSRSTVSSLPTACICNSGSRVSAFMYDMELNGLDVSEQPERNKQESSKMEDKPRDIPPNKKLAKEQKQWFRKQTKIKNEPLIYYAEMKECSSFPRYMRQSIERSRRKQKQCKSYLEKVMSKQYKPKVLVFDCQSTGELSVPVCREEHDSLASGSVHSDLCSCCYGNFQNIDKYMSKPQYSTILEEPSTSRQQCYYDDKFYDIVPVKEKTNAAKAKHEEKLQQKDKLQQKINMQNVLEKMDMLCKPSEIRPKIRPVTVNYHTITPNRNWDSQKLNRKEKFLTMNKLIKKQKSASRHSTNTTCSIECGNVYAKNINPGIKLSKLPKSRRMKYADLETLHINKNKEQPNTTASDKQADVKTEETLKQIKSILISVLSEVKSSSQSQPLGKEKRDVVIQKGLSHSDMVYSNSGLLHNFSYGPYGMNPYVANSQMHPNVCYPMTCPLRYSQNYPILVQTQPRPLCTGCYKPRSKESQQFSTKRIISASTNTANESKRTTETENLIKEIYKSMALGLETPIPTRTTDALTRGPSDKSVASKNTKNPKAKIDEVTSPFVTLENKSVTARVNVTSFGEDKQKKRISEDPPASDIDGYKEDLEEESESEESTAKSESAESESTVVAAKETSKGLFSKMMSSIFKKKDVASKKGKRKKETPVSDDEASDSDDYQTVYSHEIPTTSAKRELRRPAKTTYSHSKRPIPLRKERREKKYNYFKDEEYRRQWAMKLAERENRRFIERPHKVPSSIRGRRNAYAKNYETLQALMQYRDEFEDGKRPWTGARGQRWSRSTRVSVDDNEPVEKNEGWLKRHKLLPKCLPEWKKIIFER